MIIPLFFQDLGQIDQGFGIPGFQMQRLFIHLFGAVQQGHFFINKTQVVVRFRIGRLQLNDFLKAIPGRFKILLFEVNEAQVHIGRGEGAVQAQTLFESVHRLAGSFRVSIALATLFEPFLSQIVLIHGFPLERRTPF